MNCQTRNRHRTRTTYHADGDLSVDSENDVSAAHGITGRRRTRGQKGWGRIGGGAGSELALTLPSRRMMDDVVAHAVQGFLVADADYG